MATTMATGSDTNTESEAEHPAESTINTLYIPAQRPETVNAVSPVFQSSIQEEAVPVPPVGLPVTEPSQLPLHIASVAVNVPPTGGGSLTVTELLSMQPEESVTSTV
jgi:hypothetical protein